MTQPLTRFDIKYNMTPGRELLKVACNYPETEGPGARKHRIFVRGRARSRWATLQPMIEGTTEEVDKFIVDKLGVGSKGPWTHPLATRFAPMSSQQNLNRGVNDVLRALGNMPGGDNDVG